MKHLLNTNFGLDEFYFSYTKTCSAISCSGDLEILVRTFYFDEFLKSLKTLGNLDKDNLPSTNIASLDDHFKIFDIKLLNADQQKIIQDKMINVQLRIESNFPREILCEKIALCFEMAAKIEMEQQTATISGSDNKISTVSLADTASTTVAEQFSLNDVAPKLPIFLHLDYKQDNSLSCASVVCDTKGKQPVRRSSSTRRKISPTGKQ
jgi:trafficking protein particle complex subunit 10